MSREALLTWVDVCPLDELTVDRGVCVLAEGVQVAVFRVAPDDDLYAVSNFDPIGRAFVMSRGIVGSRGDIPKVASPLYKQNFDLRTGLCLDDPSISLQVFPIHVADGMVRVGVAGASSS